MVAVGFAIVTCLASCAADAPGKSTAAVCDVINSTLYYPTIPASGEHISVQAATRIEQLLKDANDSHLGDQGWPTSDSRWC